MSLSTCGTSKTTGVIFVQPTLPPSVKKHVALFAGWLSGWPSVKVWPLKPVHQPFIQTCYFHPPWLSRKFSSSTSCTCSCAGPIVEPLSRTFHAQSIVGTSQLASLSLSLELRAFLSHWLEVWFSVQTFGFPVNRHQERTTVSFDLDFSASMACEKETLSHQQLPLSSPYRRLCNFVLRKLINLRAQFIGQIFH